MTNGLSFFLPRDEVRTWFLKFAGWLDTDVKVHNNFLEEDDLGFDPFHESQKALLVEMLESESKAAEAQASNKVST